mmetsp:Transcript_20834/g.35521  ORF Transcript_20834/g.35521 Transcript_20834/m.35521 type:complete len:283 (-) Transcript_20834:8-856(-)
MNINRFSVFSRRFVSSSSSLSTTNVFFAPRFSLHHRRSVLNSRHFHSSPRLLTEDEKIPAKPGFLQRLRNTIFKQSKEKEKKIYGDTNIDDKVEIVNNKKKTSDDEGGEFHQKQKDAAKKIRLESQDLESLGRKGMGKVSKQEQDQLNSNLSVGLFTLQDFMIQLKMSDVPTEPKAAQEQQDNLKYLQLMTEEERKSNALLKPSLKRKIQSRIMRDPKNQLESQTLTRILNHFQLLQITHKKCFEWHKAGETIPNNFDDIVKRCEEEGAFDELRSKHRRKKR